MNILKTAAIMPIAIGILVLLYGGFSYSNDTIQAKVGSIELTVKDKQTVTIPVGVGVDDDRDRRCAPFFRQQTELVSYLPASQGPLVTTVFEILAGCH